LPADLLAGFGVWVVCGSENKILGTAWHCPKNESVAVCALQKNLKESKKQFFPRIPEHLKANLFSNLYLKFVYENFNNL
jgi:hypothetical protein